MGESASSSLASSTSTTTTSTPHNTSASIDYSNRNQFRRAHILNNSSNSSASNSRAITSASVNPEYLSRT